MIPEQYSIYDLSPVLLITELWTMIFQLSFSLSGGGRGCCQHRNLLTDSGVGNLSPAMRARNQVDITLSCRLASLCSLASQFQTSFLESIPRPIAELKFPTQVM